MASYGYGATAPGAIEPFNIETTLANNATKDSPQEAYNLLSMYHNQNMNSIADYNQNLQGQHDFARQQLAQEMYLGKLKEFPTIAKLPGGARFLASDQGIPGMDMGAGSDALTNLANAGDLANAAVNFKEAGTGFNQFAQGGLQVNPNAVPGMAGVPGKLTDPALVRAAQIRANAQIAAAGIGANRPPSTTVSTQMPLTAAGDTSTVSTSGRNINPEAERAKQIAQADAIRAARSGTSTNVQPNQSSQLDTNSANGRVAQQKATVWLDSVKKAADSGNKEAVATYNDVKSKMQGPVFTMDKSPTTGQFIIKGARGSYPIGN